MSLLSSLVFTLREIVFKKLSLRELHTGGRQPAPALDLDHEIQGFDPDHDIEMGCSSRERVSVFCIWGYVNLPPNG